MKSISMNQIAKICVVLLSQLLLTHANQSSLPPPCDSEIFCHGRLLHTVQMAHLFKDSKHFVDMTLIHSPQVTLTEFNKLMLDADDNPTQEQVRTFVDANFKEPEAEFVPWVPDDWVEEPEFLTKVVDPELEKWGVSLNAIWKKLGRKISEDVKNDPSKYSQIYVDNPVIVPGGRFREFYYWDSYWTMEGLLLCNMTKTVRGMLENFVQMVKVYGMVPNGGRVYYTRRSQPPYLIPMFKQYLDYTGDFEFVRQNLDFLETEFMFWENNRTEHVRDPRGKVHKVTQYHVRVDAPRPESYKEDYELAQNLSTREEKQDLYVELKSGAESGWDYSTRWFVVGDTNEEIPGKQTSRFIAETFSTIGDYVRRLLRVEMEPIKSCSKSQLANEICEHEGDLSDLNVTAIAPVDLNSLICMNARLLSDFFKRAGNLEKSSAFDDLANVKNQTIAELFWDEADGIWYDVNIHTEKKRKYFYLSNIYPLYTGCYGMEGNRADVVKKVLKYLENQNVVEYVGGVPTTKAHSGQQWDYPNAWAPLQHTVIMGLHKAGQVEPEAETLAFSLAEKWIRNNWKGYQDTGAMFEKYGVNTQGKPGSGGEYEVVLGFGWSNGVALKFLETYGDRLTATVGGSEALSSLSLVSLLLCSFIHLCLRLRHNL